MRKDRKDEPINTADRDIVIKPSHKRLPHNDAIGIPYNRMGNVERFVDRSAQVQEDDDANENEEVVELKKRKK